MSGAVDHRGAIAERYTLEHELGRGGMGVVFLARDLKHDRQVAVKFLSGDLSSHVGAERFQREIRTTARLSHPHILPIHDSGAAAGQLYYVMPHVDGESLRARLDREGALRIPEALRIACQMADALAYAHARGVVHRDIKPENILLDQRGHAYLADFGIARVLAGTDGGGRLTSTRTRIGSPAYMSPEQLAGDQDLDGSSDIYSLGCVMFEMIAGRPPFDDREVQVVFRRHLVDEPPSLRELRADVPRTLDRLIRGMLAKSPAARVTSADALGRALEGELSRATGEAGETHGPVARVRARKRTAIVIAASILGALLLWVFGSGLGGGGFLFGVAPDPSRYLVLPLQWQGGTAPSEERSDDMLLHAAFARWGDIDLVQRLRVNEAVERRGGPDAVTASAGLAIARELDAGRFVHGLATDLGDSVQVEVSLSDALDGGRLLRRASVRLPRSGLREGYRLLADELLFGRVAWDDGPETDVGTRSSVARRAYGEGRDALERFDLVAADSLFSLAIEHDPAFARAQLWLAHARNWRGAPIDAWQDPARRAAGATAALTERQVLLARGLVLLTEGRFPEACAAYRKVLEIEESGFGGWYGIGECHRRDPLVRRDATSPSRWSFRSSSHAAVRAYTTAYTLSPASHRTFRDAGLDRVRDLLFTRANWRRSGVAEDGSAFLATPQWLGDSLAFVPYAWPGPQGGRQDASHERAVREQRRIFNAIARAWAAASPRSATAQHALALSLEMLGDPTALDTVRAGRALASEGAQSRQLAIRQVWMLVKFGAPERIDYLESARLLADSLLASPDADVRTASELAGLAVLLGRPAAAARYARSAAVPIPAPVDIPASLVRSAEALLVFAAVGGPADSINTLAALVDGGIRTAIGPEDVANARSMLLERPATLVFPRHSSDGFFAAEDARGALARAIAAQVSGDVPTARSQLETHRRARSGVPFPALTMDGVYPEAELLAAWGEDRAAGALLDSAFASLRWMQPGMLEDAARTGALVRAMALRARIAARQGDRPAARQWTRSVTTLWSTAEPSARESLQTLAPLVAAQQ